MVEKNSVNKKGTGRLPKFIKQKKIAKPLKSLTEDRWKAFLNTHKGPGKKQSIGLWLFLLEPRNASKEVGILYLDILNHMKDKFSMSRSRVDTLMGHMEKWHLVKKQIRIVPTEKTTNKNRVFYQVCGEAITPVFTEKGTAKDYPRLLRENRELKNNLEFAINLLEQNDLIEEYDIEMKRRKVLKEQWKSISRNEILRKIRNETPEEFQNYKINLEQDRKFYLRRDLEKLSEIKSLSLSEPSTTDRTQ